MALHYVMQKNSRDEHNQWRLGHGPSTLWILMA